MFPYADVPQPLKNLPHWVCWKFEVVDNEETKVPYDPKTGRHAKANDPATWSDFATALAAADVLNGSDKDGIGFELLGTEFGGIDFDSVVGKDGKPEPFVENILELLGNPYTEITPSGTGVRCYFMTDKLPGRDRKFSTNHYGAEIYHGSEKGRYFTITADQYSGSDIPKIDDLSIPYFLIQQMRDDKFKRLWCGDASDYENDDSRADLALLGMLSRKLKTKDRETIERFFNASVPGHREKWVNREDYRDITFNKLLNDESTAFGVSPAESSTAKKRELKFTKPAVTTGTHRDYVIAPAIGQTDGWFPLGALSIISGSSGTGKTTLIYQLLLAQTMKAEFFGHQTYGRPFITMAVDRGEAAHKRTMERMRLAPEAIPFKSLPANAWDVEAAQAIVDRIETLDPLPEVVFVEGIDMLISKGIDLKEVSKFAHHLYEIAEHFHLALIGSTGAPKAREGQGYAGARDNVFGSTGWGRIAEAVALMQFPKDDDTSEQRKLKVVLRNGKAEKFTLGLVDGIFEVQPDAPEEDNNGSKQTALEIEWFKTQAQLATDDPKKLWWTVQDMEEALNLKHATAERHVKNAYTKKYLRRKTSGGKGQGGAHEFRWNDKKTNPLWVEEQKQVVEAEEMVF